MKNYGNSLRLILGCMLLALVTTVNTLAAGKQMMVLFPVDNGAGAENSQVASKISSRLAEVLKTDDRYDVIIYNSRLASVERLVKTSPQKKISVNGPFASNAKALSDAYAIADALSASIAIVGSLDRCGLVDDSKYEALLTLQILDVKKKEPIQMITAVGTASGDTGTALDAALNATDKIIQQITDKKVESVASTKGVTIKDSDISVIIGPFGYPESEDSAIQERNKRAAIKLAECIRKQIIGNKIFTIINYTQSSPPISRIVKEGKIKAKEVSVPIDTTKAGAQKAQILASAMGVDCAVIGSIDSITVDNSKASVMATVQLIEASTGKAINYITVRGVYTKVADEDENVLIDKAIGDACSKIIEQLKSQ